MSKQAKTPPDQPEARGLADLGSEMVRREMAPGASFGTADERARAVDAPGAPGALAAEVVLTMADLQADANGEIVFFNDSGFRRLAIRTDAAVVADGRSTAHRTAAGDDVGGFRFVRFDNGLTLYYEGGLDLVVGTG